MSTDATAGGSLDQIKDSAAYTKTDETPPTSVKKDTSEKIDNGNQAPTTPKAKADQYPHHVIFVVHGMGRQLEEFGNYERNVGYLVENTKVVLQSQFHELKTDVHIIPIEWHAKLHSMVDERMALASLKTVPKVRLVMNDYFADILYYFNNHFGSEIIKTIVDELNEAYSTFITKHPDFNGKIAIYALSLGGVAMFDILTCMDDDELESESETSEQHRPENKSTSEKQSTDNLNEEPLKKKPRVRKQDQPKFRAIIPKLKFRPDILFTVGSPVGAIMVMRNLEWESFHPPDDILHHNIFHPFDPLAYRLEPLIDPIFAAIPAVTLTSTGNSQLFPISLPSLPSLSSIPIPGSISSFWENKVPAIPKPSIPALSTLSQMTHSLKTGRWLPGGGGGSNRESGASTPIGDDTRKVDDGSTSNESDGEVSSSDQQNKTGSEQGLSQDSKQKSQTRDKNVSLTEAIAAAAVATYLDQRDGLNTSSMASDSSDNTITTTTTTTATNSKPTPTRRPSLGPSRISSRSNTDENTEATRSKPSASLSINNPLKVERNYSDDTIMDMERVLGTELDPSAEEKARGIGARSDVVLENFNHSTPSSPTSERNLQKNQGIGTEFIREDGVEGMQARHVELEKEKAKNKKMDEKSRRATTINEGDEEDSFINDNDHDEKSSSHQGENTNKHSGNPVRQKLTVSTRETKVPYRIDHVLQETTVDQYTNEYLLGMRSHFRYWGNRDIAYHILRTMLRPGESVEGEALNLQPDMPAPVTAPKGAKEAAEAKAKAAGAALHQNQGHSHKKSFSFSFNYRNQDKEKGKEKGKEENQRGSNSRTTSGGYYSGYGYGDDGQLQGHRYADLDVSSAANVPYMSSNTLYQSSPFANSAWEQSTPTSTSTSTHATSGKQESHGHGYQRRYPTGEDHGTAKGATSPERGSSSQKGGEGVESSPPLSSPRAFEEGILIPDLARPPKSHYRTSRIEERRSRTDF